MNIWVCIGSGPSLTDEDIEFCRRRGWKLATCNSTFHRVPDCSLFHAMDLGWWQHHSAELESTVSPECLIYTGCPELARENKRLIPVSYTPDAGFSMTDGLVKSGKLTGLQLIQIVGWQRPDVILLLGYDNQITDGRAHEHSRYNQQANPSKALAGALDDYEALARQSPYPIINCSRQSAIQAFPRMTIEDAYYSLINDRERLIYNVKRWLSLGWYR